LSAPAVLATVSRTISLPAGPRRVELLQRGRLLGIDQLRFERFAELGRDRRRDAGRDARDGGAPEARAEHAAEAGADAVVPHARLDRRLRRVAGEADDRLARDRAADLPQPLLER